MGGEHDLLAGDLGVHVVHAVGPHRRALVHLALEVEAEHDDRGQVHEALHAAAGRGVEHEPRGDTLASQYPAGELYMPDDRGGVDDHLAARGPLLPLARLRDVALRIAGSSPGAQVDAGDLAAERAAARPARGR